MLLYENDGQTHLPPLFSSHDIGLAGARQCVSGSLFTNPAAQRVSSQQQRKEVPSALQRHVEIQLVLTSNNKSIGFFVLASFLRVSFFGGSRIKDSSPLGYMSPFCS